MAMAKERTPKHAGREPASDRKTPFADVKKLERELGLPDGWYFSLLKETSDWAFVIKLHALFEAALVHVIDANLKRPELRDHIERLAVHGRLGKVAVAKALKAIEPKHIKFIEALSGIRNDCIHDVRNVNFSFEGYIDGLPNDDRNRVLAAFSDLLQDELPLEKDKTVSRDVLVKGNTQLAFWIAATLVLAEIYLNKELAEVLSKGFLERRLTDIFPTGPGMLSPALLVPKQDKGK
jgi:hypothetical protein